MRTIPTVIAFCAALTAAAAYGQTGPYGAPDMIRLGRPPEISLGSETSASVASQTLTTVPVAQTIPAGQPYVSPVNRGSTPYLAATSAYYSPPTARPMVAGSGAEGSTASSPYKTLGSVRVASNASSGSVVDQMLQEGSVSGGHASLPAVQPLAPQSGSRYQACAPTGCGPTSCGPTSCGEMQSAGFGDCYGPSPWFATVDALYMTRDHGNGVVTSVSSVDPYQTLMTSGQEMPWRVGGEARFGRRFFGDAFAVEGVYWTLDNFDGDWTATNVNGVSTPLAVDRIAFAGVNGSVFFNNVQEHALHRSDDMQNAELNFVFNPMACNGCSSHVNWSLGLRYFRFNEQLSLTSGFSSGPNSRATLAENVHNELFGGQAGFDLGLQVLPRSLIFLNAKVGVFNNQMDSAFNAYRGDGVVAVPVSGAVGSYPAVGSKSAVSLISELRAGVHVRFAPNIGGEVGYRVMGVTGVALSDHQIPVDVTDFGQLGSVKNNGNLLLHGGFAGVTFNF